MSPLSTPAQPVSEHARLALVHRGQAAEIEVNPVPVHPPNGSGGVARALLPPAAAA